MTELAEGDVIAGKYRLVRQIGRGGMGSVWAARHLHLETYVALKFIDPLADASDAKLRFEREAKAAAQLRSPHVVQILDHGVDEELPYIAMELLEGEDLGERLRKEKRLSLQAAARIFSQAAKALRRAHDAGVIHRDLKPSNIFLARFDDDEVVKLLDFGVAKLRDAGPGATEFTRTGVIFGSPAYMSPEQARGARVIDHRSDLWSLAVILFRAITGVKPFEAASIGDLVIKLCIDPLPVASSFAPDLPAGIDSFFEHAFARDPELRFQSAMAMVSAFETVAFGATVTPRPGADAMDTSRSIRLSAIVPPPPLPAPPPSVRSTLPIAQRGTAAAVFVTPEPTMPPGAPSARVMLSTPEPPPPDSDAPPDSFAATRQFDVSIEQGAAPRGLFPFGDTLPLDTTSPLPLMAGMPPMGGGGQSLASGQPLSSAQPLSVSQSFSLGPLSAPSPRSSPLTHNAPHLASAAMVSQTMASPTMTSLAEPSSANAIMVAPSMMQSHATTQRMVEGGVRGAARRRRLILVSAALAGSVLMLIVIVIGATHHAGPDQAPVASPKGIELHGAQGAPGRAAPAAEPPASPKAEATPRAPVAEPPPPVASVAPAEPVPAAEPEPTPAPSVTSAEPPPPAERAPGATPAHHPGVVRPPAGKGGKKRTPDFGY